MLVKLKRTVQTIAPPFVRESWTKLRSRWVDREPPNRTRADIFSEIYEKNRWGGTRGEFYSGEGSDDAFTEDFSRVANALIEQEGVASVVDLGCGDFRTGRRITKSNIQYIGIDVVESLIERNGRLFGSSHVEFRTSDIVVEELPAGELCIVRQVLQHLSNSDIKQILPKLTQYRFVLIAEHHPDPGIFRRPNLDKPAGPHVRAAFGSGVYLDQPPFSIPDLEIACETPTREGGRIVTYLMRGQSNK